jgi:serine/threonine protein kinase
MAFAKDVTLGEFIGHGAHGIVFHATWKGKPYALKKIRMKDEKMKKYVEREVEILSDCDHPSILKMYHYWEAENDGDTVVCILMDLCTKVRKLTMEV